MKLENIQSMYKAVFPKRLPVRDMEVTHAPDAFGFWLHFTIGKTVFRTFISRDKMDLSTTSGDEFRKHAGQPFVDLLEMVDGAREAGRKEAEQSLLGRVERRISFALRLWRRCRRMLAFKRRLVRVAQ